MSDSRKRFEEWYQQRMGESTGIYKRTPINELRDQQGGYGNRPYLDGCWVGWSTRDSEVERLREALKGAAWGLRNLLLDDSPSASTERLRLIGVAESLLSSQDKESA